MENFKKLATWTLGAVLLVSCAKEKEYDTVYREVKLQKKSDFKTHTTVTQKDGTTKSVPVKYLYVPMTLGTPKDVTQADPFYQGDEKVVRLEWSEAGLEVLEIERDDRFTDNDLNDTPVLTIPGKYTSYRCREDAYGECTNNEEVNREVEWYQNDHFTPNFEGLKVREVNMLDVATVEGNSCVSGQSTKLVDYTIQDGVINVELEKTYKLSKSWSCIWRNYVNDKFSYNSFKVRFFYSLVELDKLASPNYETVHYPIPDHDEFGFFKREEKILNDNFDSQRKERRILMERWNPNRKNNELVYHLSPSYSKPENKLLLDATYRAIEVMNQEMGKANVPFKIALVEQADPSKAVSPGDLRYNSLVLIDDPLANGLLGYGPAVSNPYTGEIVKAHTNMYGGVLKSMTRWVYESAVDLSEDEVKAANPKQLVQGAFQIAPTALNSLPAAKAFENVAAMPGALPTAPAAGQAVSLTNARVKQLANLAEFAHESREHKLSHIHEHEVHEMMQRRLHTKEDIRLELEIERQKEEGTLTKDQEFMMTEQARLDRYARNNAFAVEFFPIGGTSKVVYPELKEIPGITKEDGSLKRFDTLNKLQKKQVQDIILVNSYTATLVHEIGHNLGLRHNFMGSWDKENFYTEEEAKELGMNAAPAYSSVMDYSFSEFNQMKTLGKYDVAALRFAYAREVELKDGTITKVTGPLSEQLESQGVEKKDYQFCTDENAGLSSICNRFDEGTSLVEIANFRIKRYKDWYKVRNFRDGRLNFSSYDLPGYVFARNSEFGMIRDVLEEYEFFTTIFGKDLMAQGCSPEDVAQYPVCTMINDRRDAVNVVGDFFVEVLKTPDHLCAVVQEANPRVIVEYKKLGELYDEVKYEINYVTKSCFDPAIEAKLKEEGLVVVGENGKFLNGFKDNNPNYKYSSDRAVRGTWADKVMAVKSLFKRRWAKYSTDEDHMSLMDIPAIAEKVYPILDHYTMGKPLPQPLPFKMKDGNMFQVPYVIGNDYKIEPLEDAFSWVKSWLGMPQNGRSNLVEVALKQLNTIGTSYGEDYNDVAYITRNYAAVTKYNGTVQDASKVEGDVYYYDSKARKTYSASDANPQAKLMITTINEKEVLDLVGADTVTKVAVQRTNPEPPAELTDAQKSFFKLPANWHQALVGYATQGQQLPEMAFVQTFGPVEGPLIYSVFVEGLEAMNNLIALKMEIMTTPSTDASPEEKHLYKLPLQLLVDYANGLINDQTVEYYKAQLKRLPKHEEYANY